MAEQLLRRGPPVSSRTVLTMNVIGWLLAKACIQLGMVADRHVGRRHEASGNTRNDMPWADWGLPATGRWQMKSQTKAKPYSTQSPKAASAGARRAAIGSRRRSRRPSSRARPSHQRVSARPGRDDGQQADRQAAQPVEQARPRCPRPRRAAPMPGNSTPVTTKPGTRKSTYGSPVSIAPPKT